LKRLSILAAAAILGCGASDDDTRAVLASTKTTAATYASYQWMIERGENGENEDGWAAEFNSGDWHRIENRFRHVLGNCRTHELFEFEVATGEVRHGKDTGSAVCGVALDGGIDAIARSPSIKSAYGTLDTIRVTDKERVRHYQVDKRGILFRVDWFPRDGSRFPCLVQQPVAILPTLPAKNIFSEKTLATTVTPEKYRGRPQAVSDSGPSGKRCGG
jgi:hypothetical protein